MASNMTLYARRRITNAIAVVLATLAAIVGLAFLAWILYTVITRGMPNLNLDLFTEMTPPPGETGGMLNAFVGSLIMCIIAIVIGTPLGILAGTWLAEYGAGRKIGTVVRFVNDILLSAPSIVLGLFVYSLLVLQTGRSFSGIAGAISLAFIVLPVVVRTTDEMLRLVPTQMREAALSLGVPQWKVIVQVLYRGAMAGIVTGVLLALARISGETAPLLFTALNNQFWSVDLNAPMASVPVTMYNFSNNPDANWNSMAWAAALVLTLFVLAVSLIARIFLLRNRPQND